MSVNQKWILTVEYILKCADDRRTLPSSVSVTRGEIARVLGVSTPTAKKALDTFVEHGLMNSVFYQEYGRFGLYEYVLTKDVVKGIK